MNDELRTAGSPVIRTALPAEVEVITDLHVRARATYYPDGLPQGDIDWRQAWLGSIRRPDGQVLVAALDGAVVGVASFRTPEDAPAETVKLFQFHVDPGHWRHGVGTALHAACAEQWRADGKCTAVLDVHRDNLRAQAFYAARGWFPDPQNPPADDDHHLYLRYRVAGGTAGE